MVKINVISGFLGGSENSEGKEGAGIGLYLTSYFLKEMDGEILITNEDPGLQVLFLIRTV